MATQNEPNFALFTSSDLDFLTDELFTEKGLLKKLFTETNKRHFNGFACVVYSFARVLCNRYDARWNSKSKSQNTRKWRNGGIINLLLDGLSYNTSGHFAHCSYFSSPLRGSEKYYATRKISARIIC